MNTTRIRALGISVGSLPTGPRNKITDVPGVTVGHFTLDDARHKTGLTVILPAEGNLFTHKLTAATTVINGFGKTAGLMQIRELGTLETPIVLTSTLNTGKMADALVGYTLEKCARDGVACCSVNPVVGETNDSTLSDNSDRPLNEEHLRAAVAAANADFPEGDVGAGKGTVCMGLKGGIGSASRVLDPGGDRHYTLGVLVQSNFGCIEDLRIDGLPVGRAVIDMLTEETAAAPQTVTGQDDIGSIMIVVGTDLPLSELQLERVLRHAVVGLARTGSHIGHGSGDVVIGFTTANRHGGGGVFRPMQALHDDRLDIAFRAVAECVEEAIYNSLMAADRVTAEQALCNGGAAPVTVRALGEFLPEALERARRMASTGGR